MYSFVKVGTLYPKAIESWQQKFPDHTTFDYQKAVDSINYHSYGWGNFYEEEFNNLGIRADQIISDVSFLQSKWAEENSLNARGLELLIIQLNELKPDVVFFEDSHTYGGEVLDEIRKKVPSIKICIGFNCAPYSPHALTGFKAFDIMVTCTPGFKIEMEKEGIKCELINHAFHPTILDRIKKREHQHDLTFIGGIFLGSNYHNKRRELIETLLKKDFDLDIFGYLNEPQTLKGKIKGAVTGNSYSRKLKEKLKAPFFGLDMYQTIADSKIILNNHIDAVGNFAGNMRLFEATGMGTCLLTDEKENLHLLFDKEKEVVTYSSVEECIDKLNWLNNDPDKRKEIAEAGQQRTLRDHTFKNRAKQLNEVIQRELGR